MYRRRAVAVATVGVVLRVACHQPAWAVSADATILLSRPSGLGALPVPGDGFAFLGATAMSGDGRFIVFTSGADDLGVRDGLRHAWVRDTVSGTTTLIDRVPGAGAPGNGNAGLASISRDGSKVCFLSGATNLIPGTTGTRAYVATLSTGALIVADRASGAAGAIGDAGAQRCGLDATGTRVVFDSGAANLVAGDSNGAVDVFVRDLGTASTTRVSLDALDAQSPSGGRASAISADGSKVVFESGSALVPGDTNNANDIFLRDTQADTTVRASVGTGNVQANGRSFDAAIDDTGTHVAFASDATNLDLGADTNGVFDVFWRALGSDTTILVSRATGGAGALADDGSFLPAISGDGLGVAFQSSATNLGAGTPPPQGAWVYLRRLGTNVTSLLSRAGGASGDPANRAAARVSLGSAPVVAAWQSDASNLDPAASGEFTQAFKHEFSGTPITTLVSRPSGTGTRSAEVNDSGLAADESAGAQTISADGRLVVFVSLADGIDPVAGGRFSQVFVRDNVTDATTLVSRGPGPTGAVGNGDALGAAIAAGGTHVAFFSRATNLLPGVTIPEIYVRDLATGALEVASRTDGPTGTPALAIEPSTPDISADGRRVVFTAGDPLVNADGNSARDVYVRDLVSGTTTLVSVGANGGAGDDDSGAWSMSDDATRVAFESDATNLLATGPVSGRHLYVRDLVAGTTTVLDRDPQTGEPSTASPRSPEISGAGNRVAFFANQPLTAEPIPPSGAIYVFDVAAEVTLLASREDGADGSAAALVDDEIPPSIDQDGTRVGWSGSGAGLPGGADTLHVYLRDLAAGTTRLVSAIDGSAAIPGNGRSSNVALDAAGSCVAFDSVADDLTTLAYPTQDFRQVYLRAMDDGCLPTVTATTSTTTTTLPPGSGNSIPAKALVLRPGKLVKLVAKGLAAPPITSVDPTRGGGSLNVAGTTGSASFALPPSGWKAVGRRKPKGFKFKGAECRVTLLERRLKAACRGAIGTLRLPEPGPLEVVLVVEQEAYCVECGGKPAGRADRVFKRTACPAPGTCP
jgi:Tol biopolymer transport system component